MQTTTSRKKADRPASLTKAEQSALDRLRALPDESRRARYVYDNLFRYHRGSYIRKGVCVVYGNDGFSSDVRSRREAVRVAERIEAMGLSVAGFGLAGDGYTWVLVVRFGPETTRDDQEFYDWRLNSIISDIWFEMAGLGPDFASKIDIERSLGHDA